MDAIKVNKCDLHKIIAKFQQPKSLTTYTSNNFNKRFFKEKLKNIYRYKGTEPLSSRYYDTDSNNNILVHSRSLLDVRTQFRINFDDRYCEILKCIILCINTRNELPSNTLREVKALAARYSITFIVYNFCDIDEAQPIKHDAKAVNRKFDDKHRHKDKDRNNNNNRRSHHSNIATDGNGDKDRITNRYNERGRDRDRDRERDRDRDRERDRDNSSRSRSRERDDYLPKTCDKYDEIISVSLLDSCIISISTVSNSNNALGDDTESPELHELSLLLDNVIPQHNDGTLVITTQFIAKLREIVENNCMTPALKLKANRIVSDLEGKFSGKHK